MKLQRGVVFHGPTELARERITLYSGSRREFSPSFATPAFVPDGVARVLTDEELSILCDRVETVSPGAAVALCRGSFPIGNLFRKAIDLAVPKPPASNAEARERRVASLRTLKIGRALADQLVAPEHTQTIESKGITSRKTGLITSTRDENGLFIGLHVDSFYDAAVESRLASPGRLCINLGVEPRYLLFINLELQRCLELIGLQELTMNTKALTPEAPLPESFLRLFPDYPVLRLRVDPDEAYLAPTENIIHDSQTLERKTEDAFLTFLGLFDPRKVDQISSVPLEEAASSLLSP